MISTLQRHVSSRAGWIHITNFHRRLHLGSVECGQLRHADRGETSLARPASKSHDKLDDVGASWGERSNRATDNGRQVPTTQNHH